MGISRQSAIPSSSETTRLLLTPEAAAYMLDVSRSTVYDLMRCGSLQSVRIRRVRRIPTVELDRFIRELAADALVTR